MTRRPLPARQRGITLVLSLIMLILLTIMALSSFNIGKSSLQVVDNAQQQGQVINAAADMLNQLISSPAFADAPTAALSNDNCPSGVSAPTNSRCVDLYGDGKTVIVVKLDPVPFCTQVKPLLTGELNVADPEEAGCTLGECREPGRVGACTGWSLCSDSMWEVTAKASEQVSRSSGTVTQGVKMRVSNDAVSTACP